LSRFRALGDFGFLSESFTHRETIWHRATAVFPLASSAKLLALVALARLVEEGTIKFTTILRIQERDIVQGSGVIKTLRRRTFTVQELCKNMVTASDNIAFNTLINLITPKVLNEGLRKLGLTSTFVGSLLPGTLHNNRSTPRDMGLLLSSLYHMRLPGAAHILRVLRANRSKSFLADLLPTGCRILHKTGVLDHATNVCVNDVGLVMEKRLNYSVCFFTRYQDDRELGALRIAVASRMLYDHWNEHEVRAEE
jgi:beta-lactamase class A